MPSWPSLSASTSHFPGPSPFPESSLSGASSSHGRLQPQHLPFTSGLAALDRIAPPPVRRKVSGGDSSDLGQRDAGKSVGSTVYQKSAHPRNGAFGMGGGKKAAEITTGNCVCCDSTVRWPTGLTVFRCTICMTVNDLEPSKTPPTPSGDIPLGKTLSPLSVERTRTIINCCTEEFLQTHRLILQTPKYPPPPPPLAPLLPEASVIGDIPRDPSVPQDDLPQTRSIQHDNMEQSSSRLPEAPTLLSTLEGLESISTPIDRFRVSSTRPLYHAPPSRPPPLPPKPGMSPVKPSDADMPDSKHASKLRDGENGHDSNFQTRQQQRELTSKMFKSLEDYLISAFSSWECLNASFLKLQPGSGTYNTNSKVRAESAKPPQRVNEAKTKEFQVPVTNKIGEKEVMLLMGRGRHMRRDTGSGKRDKERDRKLSLKSPGIDWGSVSEFYETLMTIGADIPFKISRQRLNYEDGGEKKHLLFDDEQRKYAEELAADIEEARNQLCRALLKATESLLRRPGKPLKKPEDIRFLLIILANPLLYSSSSRPSLPTTPPSSPQKSVAQAPTTPETTAASSSSAVKSSSSRPGIGNGGGPGHHSGIIKRILGLLSNLPNECHHYLVSWFSRVPEDQFRRLVELGGSFVTYRLTRQNGRKRSRSGNRGKQLVYNDDWQIRAAARVMSLLFSANSNTAGHRTGASRSLAFGDGNPAIENREARNTGTAARREAQQRGLIIPTSDFYNMLLDYYDLIADFDSWESRTSKFCFCQYPFFMSMGAKISILEHDAKRQMEVQARQAFFSSIASRRAINQYLILKVRRECLVEDSLKGISEGVGGVDEIKKGLRIEFVGEDGVDAGGLKKEWFLLVVRDVFDPNYGMFVYDEDSRYCYFNPNSFETSEEFYLIGVLFGLAIYNSTILDVALPPYLFKKLIYSTSPHTLAISSIRPPLHPTLEDLATFRPALANGLRKLLEFEGDVQETFCRDFVAEIERFGSIIHVPLCANGENRPVTNANRREFVDLYVKYLLDTGVTKQFEPFKRGFYTVCGGNALSLFRPEEIELLIRGSDEPLDVSALKAVAIYDGWGTATPADDDPVVKWFWSFFEKISPKDQRLLLGFITGSDRIPAMGATNLTIKVVCLGLDCNRFPVARTCFNQICLWRYKRREKLENLLWRAVTESEGFGLK